MKPSNHLTTEEAREMPDVLRLTLPLPPSTNNAYTNSKKGRILTREARDYKQAVLLVAMQAGAPKMGIRPPCALTLTVYFADARRDLANTEKLITDSLMAAIGGDDRYVEELLMYRRADRSSPRVEVELRSLS